MFWRGHPQQNERCNPRCLVHLGLFIFACLSFSPVLFAADPEMPWVIKFDYYPKFPEDMDEIVQQRQSKIPGDKSKELRVAREPIRLNHIINDQELENYTTIIESSFSRLPVFQEHSQIQCRKARDPETPKAVRDYCQKIVSLGLISTALSYLLPVEADLRLKYPFIPLYRLCFAYSAIAEGGLRNMLGVFHDEDYPALRSRMESLKKEFLESNKDEIRFGNFGFNYNGFFIDIDWNHRGFSSTRKRCFDEYSNDPTVLWSISRIQFRELPENVSDFKDQVFSQLNEIYLTRQYMQILEEIGSSIAPDYQNSNMLQSWNVKEEYQLLLYPGSPIHIPEQDELAISVFQLRLSYELNESQTSKEAQRRIARRLQEITAQIDVEMDRRILELEAQVLLNGSSGSSENLNRLMNEKLEQDLPLLRKEFSKFFIEELMTNEDLSLQVLSSEELDQHIPRRDLEDKFGSAFSKLIQSQTQARASGENGVYLPFVSDFGEEADNFNLTFLYDFRVESSSYQLFEDVFKNIESSLLQRWNSQNLIRSLKLVLRSPRWRVLEPDTFWELGVSRKANSSEDIINMLLEQVDEDSIRKIIIAAVKIHNLRVVPDPEVRDLRKIY